MFSGILNTPMAKQQSATVIFEHISSFLSIDPIVV